MRNVRGLGFIIYLLAKAFNRVLFRLCIRRFNCLLRVSKRDEKVRESAMSGA